MKTAKRVLSVLLSLLMLLPLVATPLQSLADTGTAQALDASAFEYDANSIVAEFKYQSDNTTLLAAPQTQSSGDGGKAYANVAQVDLTAYTYSNLYMQMDVDANQGLDMVIYQPFLNGDARNHVIYSDWPEVKTANSINGYYTLSIPMTNIELKMDCFSVYAPPTAPFQWKNRKVVNMTRDDILAKLNAAIAGINTLSADDYLDVTAIQAAATDAQASIDANADAATLMNKWNILRAQYHLLETIPETAAEDLANILAETLPEGAVYDRDKIVAYEAAVAAGTVVNNDANATAGQKFAAYVAIRDAKEALGFNIEYQVINFPPVNGSDENGVIQWTAGNNFHMSTLTNTVDVSDHNSAKLRFRVDLQLVSGDISGASLFVLQPRDENNQMNNGSNLAGILKETLTDNEWHTFERDLSASINAYPDTWHLLKYASFHLSGTNAVLNVRNMRVVDITMEEEKVALKSRIEGKTAPADIDYPAGLLNGFNTAKAAALAVANSGEEVGTWAEVWAAEDGVDAAIAAFETYKELKTLVETNLPADKDYSAASLAVYNTAVANAEALLAADSMTNNQLTAAVKAINDAKASLVDISYVVYTFPAAPGSDENGVKTWVVGGNYDRLAFDQSIDLTTRDKSKLRLQVDIRLVSGDASTINLFTMQPVDSNNNTANVWDNSIKNLTNDGQWQTFEYNLGNFANLYNLKEVGMYCDASGITLEVGRFRIVDLSALEIKDELQALVNEGLDENKDYVAGTTDAYVAALAEAEALLADANASLTDLDGAIAAINAAKARLQDITYLVADIPENGNDPASQTATWTLPAGSEMQAYYSGVLAQRVDLSGHKPENLRYRVDIRLTNADSFAFIQMTAQPRDNSNPQNFENDWDTNVVLQKDVWYTYERDFTLSINKANEGGVDWSKIIRSDLFAMYTAPESDVILEVRNMRVVDITLEGKKTELQAIINTPVNDANTYLPSTWEAYQTALTAANTAMGEDVIRFAPVEKAMADLQAAIDGLQPGFVYDETRSTVDVQFNGDEATLALTANEGYVFIGWNVNGVFTPTEETILTVAVADLANVQPVVLNRQAGAEETMVYFFSKGNFKFDQQIVTANDDIAAILEAKKAAAPSIYGYNVADWDTPADLVLLVATLNLTLNYTVKETSDFTVTVENATATYIGEAVDSGFAAAFDGRVTVKASGTGEFKYWLLDGMVVSFKSSYTFYVSGNNVIKAVFTDDADYVASETADSVRVQIKTDYVEASADGKYKWTVIPQIYQPANCAVVEYGVIFAPASRDLSDLSMLTPGSDYVKVASSSTVPNRQYMVALRGIKEGAARQAIAYLTVTTDEGTFTYYSDAINIVAGE